MYVISGFLKTIHSFEDKQSLKAWMLGANDALWAFAVMRDGEYYVGFNGKTYKETFKFLTDQYK